MAEAPRLLSLFRMTTAVKYLVDSRFTYLVGCAHLRMRKRKPARVGAEGVSVKALKSSRKDCSLK